METYIHHTNGELTPADPFKVIGKTFEYVSLGELIIVKVTPRCIEAINRKPLVYSQTYVEFPSGEVFWVQKAKLKEIK